MERSSAEPNSIEIPLKRKRGAQPGNTNALKHGLYARYFTQAEKDDLKGQSILDSEIDMLRVAMQRLFSRTGNADEKTLTATLTALARVSASLARLIEANRRIRDQDDALVDTINQAVSQINKELSAKNFGRRQEK